MESLNEAALESNRPPIEFLSEEQKRVVKGGGRYRRLEVNSHVWVKGCYIGPSLINPKAGESIFFILEEGVEEDSRAMSYSGELKASEKECYGQGIYALQTQKGIIDAAGYERIGIFGHKVNQFFTQRGVYTHRLTEDKDGRCSVDFKYAFEKGDAFEASIDYGFSYWYPVRAVTLLSDRELLIFEQQCPESARKESKATKEEVTAYELWGRGCRRKVLSRHATKGETCSRRASSGGTSCAEAHSEGAQGYWD